MFCIRVIIVCAKIIFDRLQDGCASKLAGVPGISRTHGCRKHMFVHISRSPIHLLSTRHQKSTVPADRDDSWDLIGAAPASHTQAAAFGDLLKLQPSVICVRCSQFLVPGGHEQGEVLDYTRSTGTTDKEAIHCAPRKYS